MQNPLIIFQPWSINLASGYIWPTSVVYAAYSLIGCNPCPLKGCNGDELHLICCDNLVECQTALTDDVSKSTSRREISI